MPFCIPTKSSCKFRKIIYTDFETFSGGEGGINFKAGQIKTLFGHTHPTSAPPSNLDSQALIKLGQSKQYVFHGGNVSLVKNPKFLITILRGDFSNKEKSVRFRLPQLKSERFYGEYNPH
ncbi:MAG: hypothetical protein HC880_05920 [Bacteroidia bacterium]|nr:hypothetical protein [Bacteroidia bacterium]